MAQQPHIQASRSLCYGTPLDPELYKLTEELEQEASQRRFAELSLRAADLRGAVERLLGGWSPALPSNTAPTRAKVEALMHAADTLEADYDAHINSLPLTWKAMTLRYMDASDPTIMGGIAYVGRVDAYVDMFICYILNWARAARLYGRYCSLRCQAWLLGPEHDYRDTPEYTYAAALGARLIEDTVASVPYVFGATRMGQTAEQARQPPSLAGVFCMWPVFAASSSDFASDAQRLFLKKTLKFISEEIGIGQASILAGVGHYLFLMSLPCHGSLQKLTFLPVQPAESIDAHRLHKNETIRGPGQATTGCGGRGSGRISHEYRNEGSDESPRNDFILTARYQSPSASNAGPESGKK